MRPLTSSMQDVINTALTARRGVVRTSVPVAKGLVQRRLATGWSYYVLVRGVGCGGALVEINETGFAHAEWGAVEDALRDRDHAEALADLEPGTVVTYRGSKEDEHCFEWIVLGRGAPRGEGYVLFCRDYSWATLSQVRRASFYPTGEQLTLCAHCSHPHEHYYRDPSRCACTTCWCDQHAPVAVEATP